MTASPVCFGLPFPILASISSFFYFANPARAALSLILPSQAPFTKHTFNICDTQFLQKALCTGIIVRLEE